MCFVKTISSYGVRGCTSGQRQPDFMKKYEYCVNSSIHSKTKLYRGNEELSIEIQEAGTKLNEKKLPLRTP